MLLQVAEWDLLILAWLPLFFLFYFAFHCARARSVFCALARELTQHNLRYATI
jgi:hypothetical protein